MPGLICVLSASKFMLKTLTSNVTVFRDRALGRQLRLSEVVKVVSDSIAGLMKMRKTPFYFSLYSKVLRREIM